MSTVEVREGARAMAPMMIAYVPFAFLVGAAVASSANPLAAWLGTSTIYGGAAHLAVLDVLEQGSGWAAAAAMGLLVNARLTAYAASMAPQWRSATRRQRVLAGLMLTDAPWALARGRASGHRPFYLGAAATLFVGWPMLVTLGMVADRWVNAVPVTDLLAPLTLGSVAISQLRQRPAAAAVAAASASAFVTMGLSTEGALMVAAVAGAVAGLVADLLS